MQSLITSFARLAPSSRLRALDEYIEVLWQHLEG